LMKVELLCVAVCFCIGNLAIAGELHQQHTPEVEAQTVESGHQSVLLQPQDDNTKNANELYMQACLLKVREVMLKKVLPEDMRGHGEISFVVRSTGKLESMEITKSSGNKLLDEIIKHAVYKAGPFDPFSEGMRKTDENEPPEFIRITHEFSYRSQVQGRYAADPLMIRPYRASD
jgi:TonB family protein